MKLENIRINFYTVGQNLNITTGISTNRTSSFLSITQSKTSWSDVSVDNGEILKTNIGGCYIVPSNKVRTTKLHSNNTLNNNHLHWIFIDATINGKSKLDDLYEFPIIMPSKYDDQIYSIIKFLNNCPDENAFFCQKMIYCYELVDILIKIGIPKDISENNMTQILNYIRNNYRFNFQSDTLAKMANLSVTHFYRSFKKHTGKSPIEYLNDYRLSIAALLLEHEEKLINDISEYVGFENQFYFSKLFSRKFGVCPRKYRNKICAKK